MKWRLFNNKFFIKLLIASGFIAICLPGYAACQAADSLVVAKEFFGHHKNFYYVDPIKLKGLVSERLMRDLALEYKCSIGEVCAIEANPWTGEQDGDLSKVIDFEKVSENSSRAIIKMNYEFKISKSKKEARSIGMVLEKNKMNGCWVFADLIQPNNESLSSMIEGFFKDSGALK